MDGHQRERNNPSKRFDMEPISPEEKEGLLGSDRIDRYNPSSRTPRPCSYIFVLSLLAVVNVILVTILASQFFESHEEPSKDEKLQPVPFGGLPNVTLSPSWLPPEEWGTQIFHREPIYGLEPSIAAQEAWRSLIPEGKGFVVVKNDTWLPDLPGLSHPNMREEQQACVAVFHQLHCLYMTYTAYWNARAGNVEQVPPEHLIHCWDYLRQSIMCAGDTTLEWVSEYSHPPNATDGWGFQHTCKNFDAIYNWAEQHRSKDDVGIS